MFDLEDYDYELPPGLIAQVPAPERDHSRLLVVDRKKGIFSDLHFFNLPEQLRPGDLLVVNDTRVFPARLFGRKETGGRIEILVLESSEQAGKSQCIRTCMLKSAKGPKPGVHLIFDAGVTGRVEEVMENGLVRIAFEGEKSIDALIEEAGQMPLPPYIRRNAVNDPRAALDQNRYQTVFSRQTGAVAAPTAGLHFTDAVIQGLKKHGVSITAVTLHVGYGTFQPVRTSNIREHRLGEERFRIAPETAKAIRDTKKQGGRVVAVGTTVVRTLETAATPDGSVEACQGRTGLLITPGFPFKVVDTLVTNFHLPKSSLLFLVAAFAGLERINQAYQWAVEKKYRFFSYGDAMLII